MINNSIDETNFEYLSELASSDPEKFEQLRLDKISELIESVTNPVQKKRLIGLQWQIDQIRAQHKGSAMAACLAISELMWETFAHLSDVLHYKEDSALSKVTPAMKENILPFPSKQNA